MSATSIESSRIAGSLKCMDALRELEQCEERICTDDAYATVAGHFGMQLADARALVSALGPLTPEQEGFIAVLAEVIHYTHTTAVPYVSGGWVPLSVHTEAELQARIEQQQAENDEFDAKFEREQRSRRKVISIEEGRRKA